MNITTGHDTGDFLGRYTQYFFGPGPLEAARYRLIRLLFSAQLENTFYWSDNNRRGCQSHSTINVLDRPEFTMMLIKHHGLIERIKVAKEGDITQLFNILKDILYESQLKKEMSKHPDLVL